MNRHYEKGRRKENKIVNWAKDKGCIAFRSAGSHSPIDICIIDIAENKISFVQSKPDDFSENKKKQLEEEMKELNNTFLVEFRVI